MPMYIWKSKVTGETVEVLRRFKDYLNSPTTEELDAFGIKDKDPSNYEKIIGKILLTKTYTWKQHGQKGSWGK